VQKLLKGLEFAKILIHFDVYYVRADCLIYSLITELIISYTLLTDMP